MMKSSPEAGVTAAVGDGGNDVGMMPHISLNIFYIHEINITL